MVETENNDCNDDRDCAHDHDAGEINAYNETTIRFLFHTTILTG